MKSLVIMRINVIDPVKLKSYQSVAPQIIEDFGGKILARGGDVASLEGPEETRRVVVIEFPSQEIAQQFYSSTAYQDAVSLRADAAEFEIISVECLS